MRFVHHLIDPFDLVLPEGPRSSRTVVVTDFLTQTVSRVMIQTPARLS